MTQRNINRASPSSKSAIEILALRNSAQCLSEQLHQPQPRKP
jgi:hypothetical protein